MNGGSTTWYDFQMDQRCLCQRMKKRLKK